MFAKEKSVDAQVNDYLLTASGHLKKQSRLTVDAGKLATYGAAAGSMMVMMSQAEAAVVLNGGDTPTFRVDNGSGTTLSSPGFRQFDIDGDGFNDFAIWSYGSSSGSGLANNGMAVAYSTYSSSSANQMYGTGGNDLEKLSAGFTIGPSTFSATGSVMDTGNDIVFSSGSGAGNWSGGVPENGFIGVRFERASGTHFGWICLQSNPSPTPGEAYIEVIAYAYEDQADTDIVVGDTGAGVQTCDQLASAASGPSGPEAIPVGGPLVYGLTTLAMGGLGLGALRRRRAIRAAANSKAAA